MIGTPVASYFFRQNLFFKVKGDLAECSSPQHKVNADEPSSFAVGREESWLRSLRIAAALRQMHKFRTLRASCYLKRVVPEDVRVLLARIMAGEKKAWNAFAEEYSPLVYRMLGKFTNLSKDDRHDVHNTVFVILLKRGLRKFRGATVHELRAYLKVITDNAAKDYLNGRDPLADTETEWDEFEHPSPDPAPDLLAGGKEAFEQVRLCLKELPVVDQEIFWMLIKGHSYEEISAMLDVPMGTVASKFNRTKAKVKECLTQVKIL